MEIHLVLGDFDEQTLVSSAWLGKTGAETRACELNETVHTPYGDLGHYYVRTLKIEDRP